LFLPNNLTTFEFYLRDGSGMSFWFTAKRLLGIFLGFFLDFF